MKSGIAIVGMACRYPDARSPAELWLNVLAQRRAFRRIPDQRLRSEDYFSADRSAPDRTYMAQAAVIEGYTFDRARFRVVGSTYRAADLAHWLALEVAADSLTDAGFAEGVDLPRDMTGVLLGNTLTGEFSRANVMRLRWPYVRRVVDAALADEEWTTDRRRTFLTQLEAQYKAPFPPVDTETLAGGLSNTIAGRICNHFDLHGGGYTVDGACSSSLLAVAHACTALSGGDLDVALAGGVDLSLDPFEIVGFAKLGALADDEMRIYDASPSGFLPGEGCGVLTLMRHDDALAQGRRVYAVIHGWGISSDGSGGLTRPELEGQLAGVRRAYARAGYGIASVALFEGHGTGTAVGDATELGMLTQAISESAGGASPGAAEPAAIGSIKANIGHTKAAAGVAGLIKATMALHHQVLPPTTGCRKPHDELTGDAPALRVLSSAEPWPADRPLRAAVSAMGFGGINAHITLQGATDQPRQQPAPRVIEVARSAQDAELFLLGGNDEADLLQQVEHLLSYAGKLSLSELADLAAELHRRLAPGQMRAAVVASRPAELADGLQRLGAQLTTGAKPILDVRGAVFLGQGDSEPRIGLLFPGQASPSRFDGGAPGRRFPIISELYDRADLPHGDDAKATQIAQPAIATASCAGVALLQYLGIAAQVAIGHSLGELAALHWAGAFDAAALVRIAAARGRFMAELATPGGTMAAVGAERSQVEALVAGTEAVIANLNAARQTVISGPADAVRRVLQEARSQQLPATALRVSNAFHSPYMAPAAPALAAHLANERLAAPQRRVVSTITGAPLTGGEDLAALLVAQLTAPVRFVDALSTADAEVDLWIESGPGRVLTGLVAGQTDTPVVALDIGGASLTGLLQTVAAAFVLGTPVQHAKLFADRFTRPFDLDWQPLFFTNPCELAPTPDGAVQAVELPAATASASSPEAPATGKSALEVVRELVADHLELPAATFDDDCNLQSDLHLNSIVIGQLVGQAAARLQLAPPQAPLDYASATIAQVAKALDELKRTGGTRADDEAERVPRGVDTWFRTFFVEQVARPRPRPRVQAPTQGWHVIAPADHPLAAALTAAFADLQWGGGVVVCLPTEPGRADISRLLAGAKEVLQQDGETHYVVVQHGPGGAGFAKTLHLEAPRVTTCVVELPPEHPEAVQLVIDETAAAIGFVEVRYDRAGLRTEPVLKLLPLAAHKAQPLLGPDDVLLVTGGGKGIAAECALALARQTDVRLALLGRSSPDDDAELAANLRRLTDAGAQVMYCSADVTDEAAVRLAVGDIKANWGPITAVIHGAGRNVPQLIGALDEAACLATLTPKIDGLRHVLAAVDPAQLRLLVTFSSIIGRIGLPGEADYALANEWLSDLTERFGREHPDCRCLALEWSVWSGVGMGQRLGRVDALLRQGISPIPPEQGVALLCDLIDRPTGHTAVVVTGRFGDPPTVRLDQSDLPLLRFVEKPRVHYPAVELVVDSAVSTDTDPYINDHVYHGQRLLPAVMGLEALAQTAMAVARTDRLPVFEDVKFERPVVIPESGSLTIRLAALADASGGLEVVLRSADTAFQADHFRALCRFDLPGPVAGAKPDVAPLDTTGDGYLPLSPLRDLYDGILFQEGRFRRLHGYRRLRATECVASLTADSQVDWFGRYLPDRVVLGDAGIRDAAIHAIQACIPHARLLPIAVERLVVGCIGDQDCFVHAVERYRQGDLFVYDMSILAEDGAVLERWEGLHLQKVEHIAADGPWVQPLLGPYLERRVQELVPGSQVTVALERCENGDRQGRSAGAIQAAIGAPTQVHHRPDGKPQVDVGYHVAAAHGADLTLAVSCPAPVGCDLEPVVARPADTWRDLLGAERINLARLIASEAKEDTDTAASRVWTAIESLKKAGAATDMPLTFASADGEGWVSIKAGGLTAATYVWPVEDIDLPLAIAIVAGSEDAHV